MSIKNIALVLVVAAVSTAVVDGYAMGLNTNFASDSDSYYHHAMGLLTTGELASRTQTIISLPTTITNHGIPSSRPGHYFSCSAPPASVEVCLTSIFASIEGVLSKIDISLKKYEISIEAEMKYEHNLLNDEISWVGKVSKIAQEVKKAVLVDYQAEYKQVKELILEKEQIDEVYEVMIKQLEYLEVEVEAVEEYEKVIVQEYVYIQKQHWSLYKYISEIEYEKQIIVKEEAEIEKVVAVLYAQIEKIDIKINELYKREDWLVSWEEKLSVDMEAFQKDIVHFRAVEVDLKKEELLLYQEQARLLVEVEYVEKAIGKLRLEYVNIVSYLKELEIYEKELLSISESVSKDAHVFISAYSEFTCEDSLLYYEACVSSVHPAPHPVPVPPHPLPPHPIVYGSAPIPN